MIGNDDFYVNTLLTYLTHPAMVWLAPVVFARCLALLIDICAAVLPSGAISATA